MFKKLGKLKEIELLLGTTASAATTAAGLGFAFAMVTCFPPVSVCLSVCPVITRKLIFHYLFPF